MVGGLCDYRRSQSICFPVSSLCAKLASRLLLYILCTDMRAELIHSANSWKEKEYKFFDTSTFLEEYKHIFQS